jgi:hypothetical protein
VIHDDDDSVPDMIRMPTRCLEMIPYEDESYWDVIGWPTRTPDSVIVTGDDGGRWAPALHVWRIAATLAAPAFTVVRTEGEVGLSTEPWQHPGHPSNADILADYVASELEAENE